MSLGLDDYDEPEPQVVVFNEAIERATPRRVNLTGVLLALVSAAGMAASITLIYSGMAMIMQTEGGFVAVGGPYEIAHPAPGWVGVLPLSILAMFLFGGLNIWASLRGWGINLLLFGWVALFISLGWNFLRFGLNPPENMGNTWGWILSGIVFWIMGVAPVGLGFSWLRKDFQQLVDRRANAETRQAWGVPRQGDTTAAYLVSQALGAALGIWAGVTLFSVVIR